MDQGWTESESPFHDGEIAAQKKVGVPDSIAALAKRSFRPFMPDQHRDFFRQIPLIYIAYMDADGWPQATALAGSPGFLKSPDPKTLEVAARPGPHDPLSKNLADGMRLGLLGLEMHSRRRNRLNATVTGETEEGFLLSVDQSFGNCPQYIQARQFSPSVDPEDKTGVITRHEFTKLNAETARFIETADTFFVASAIHSEASDKTGGADMSHRGGRPGFVRVEGNMLTVPDFVGNFFFNTLGNFLKNPRAGLLFVDFQTGDMLQLSGSVTVLWDKEELAHFQGAERGWQFTLEKGTLIRNALPLRWEEGDMSLNSHLTGTWKEAEEIAAANQLRNEWRNFKVIDIAEESDDIKSFYLVPEDGKGLLPFKAGQFLPIKVPAGEEGEDILRTYTLSSSPYDKSYRISVKKEGKVSRFLHEQVAVGDRLVTRAPRGKFHLTENHQKPAVMLAGGVGITPMLAMMRQSIQDGIRLRRLKPITLIHAAHSSADRAFFHEIRSLARGAEGAVRYASFLSHVMPDERAGQHYHGEGRLSLETLQAVLPDEACEFYLCGPAGFMQSLYNILRLSGVPDKDIYAEAFGPASLMRSKKEKEAAIIPPADQALIRFTETGSSSTWTPDAGVLLDFAEAEGLAPQFGCRIGNCGRCAVKMKMGAVTYQEEPTALVDDGHILLCCARPAAGTDEMELEI